MEICRRVPIPKSLSRAALLFAALPFTFAACSGSPSPGGGPTLIGTPEEQWLAKQYPRDSVDWDDEQAFVADNNTDFGPVVRVRANPYAYTYFETANDVESVSGGVLIAIADVEAGTRGSRYDKLELKQGRNCIWLAREGTPKRWTAYVSQANADKNCVGHTTATTLTVLPSPSPGNDVLEVARFTEDHAGNPIIGFNCAKQWCDLLPSGSSAGKTPGDKHPTPGGLDPEWKNQSRHDDEVLAKPSGGGLAKGPRAAIVPIRNLQSLKIKNGGFKSWVKVATVLMEDDPAGTKYATKGLALGLNDIQVKFDGTEWWARIVVGGVAKPEFKIAWHPHDPKYRHAQRARWKWSKNDQDGWIDCDAGCCQVSFQ